jgi:hypothetical protein
MQYLELQPSWGSQLALSGFIAERFVSSITFALSFVAFKSNHPAPGPSATRDAEAPVEQ